MINANVQNEPATSYDVELAGQLAAIGIVKGKPFKPDERMKKILTDAAAVGNAAGRALNWRYSEAHPDWAYYPGSQWGNMLWQGGAFFETPPPAFKDGMFKPLPPTGARTLDSRTAFYYGYTLDSPGMIMRHPRRRLTVSDGLSSTPTATPFDGAKTYKVTLPKDIPARAFWSFTLYDNQTRSMLDTPQKYPRAGSQSYPSPAAEAADDGSTTVYFGPEQPEGVARGNWIQTDPGEGLVHHPAPLQPAAVVLRQGLAAERDRDGAVDGVFDNFWRTGGGPRERGEFRHRLQSASDMDGRPHLSGSQCVPPLTTAIRASLVCVLGSHSPKLVLSAFGDLVLVERGDDVLAAAPLEGRLVAWGRSTGAARARDVGRRGDRRARVTWGRMALTWPQGPA